MKCFSVFVVFSTLSAFAIVSPGVQGHKQGHKPHEVCPTIEAIPPGLRSSPSAKGEYNKAAVATGSKVCSEIGRKVLADGGNAVDASIASQLCLGVVHPHSSGLGGGFFATVRIKQKKGNSYDTKCVMARETAPGASTEDMFVGDEAPSSQEGGMATGVPGELAGLAEMHDRWGSKNLKWKRLVKPAIDLCKCGYRVDKIVAQALQVRKSVLIDPDNADMYKDFLKQDNNGNIATDSNGLREVKLENDIVTRPLLLKTFLKVHEHKRALYRPPLRKAYADDIADIEGIITTQDMKGYKVAVKDCKEYVLGDYTFYGPPPPSSAAVVFFIIGIMNALGIDVNTNIILKEHWTIEALKFGFGQRTFLGDEDDLNVQELVNKVTDELMTEAFAIEAKNLISNTGVLPTSGYDFKDHGTSHHSIVDKDGNAVSLTSTINTFFGNHKVGTRTGIVFNNEMNDFSSPGDDNVFGFDLSTSNLVAPGKRPMSSMSPMIVTKNGQLVGAIGSSGGGRIISTIALMMRCLIMENKDCAACLDMDRFHHQLSPARIQYEQAWITNTVTGTSNTILEELIALGHTGAHVTREQPKEFSTAHIVWRPDPNSKICAASDWRRGGAPAGID